MSELRFEIPEFCLHKLDTKQPCDILAKPYNIGGCAVWSVLSASFMTALILLMTPGVVKGSVRLTDLLLMCCAGLAFLIPGLVFLIRDIRRKRKDSRLKKEGLVAFAVIETVNVIRKRAGKGYRFYTQIFCRYFGAPDREQSAVICYAFSSKPSYHAGQTVALLFDASRHLLLTRYKLLPFSGRTVTGGEDYIDTESELYKRIRETAENDSEVDGTLLDPTVKKHIHTQSLFAAMLFLSLLLFCLGAPFVIFSIVKLTSDLAGDRSQFGSFTGTLPYFFMLFGGLLPFIPAVILFIRTIFTRKKQLKVLRNGYLTAGRMFRDSGNRILPAGKLGYYYRTWRGQFKLGQVSWHLFHSLYPSANGNETVVTVAYDDAGCQFLTEKLHVSRPEPSFEDNKKT